MKRFISAALAALLFFNAAAGAAPMEAYWSYLRGLMALKSGDYQTALAAYEDVIALDKNAAAAYRDLATLYWQMGRSSDALAAAQKLDNLSPDSISTQLFLGSFYLLAGQTNRARGAWEQVLRLEPGNETAMLYLAAYHSSDNEPQKALEYWNQYLKKQPESAEGYYHLGMTCEKLGRSAEAKEAFLKSLSLKPDNPEAHLALAQLYERQEAVVAAAQEYERYLELVPENLSVLVYLGGLYFRSKNYDAARDVFQRAHALKPDDTTVAFWLGVLAEERKDWREAIKYFEMLREKEETTLILTRLSYYHSALREFRPAVKYLRKAVEREPQNPTLYYLLGLAYMDMKKYRAAEKNFLKALEMKSDSADAHFHLGILYDQWGRFDKAVEELEKAVGIDPKHASALNYLGYSLAERNQRLDEAESLVLRALALDPENGSYIDSLGWVYFKKGDNARAEQELARAAARLPDPVIWEHLGDVRSAAKNPSGAWEAYRASLDRDPSVSRIKKKLRASEKDLPQGELQRLLLQRAAANLESLRTLRAGFAAAGESHAINFRVYGMLHFSRPDQWRIDLLGSVLSPQVVVLHSGGVAVYPSAAAERFSPDDLALLGSVHEYFSGAFIGSFLQPGTAASEKRSYVRYSREGETLVVGRDDGRIREYSRGAVRVRFKKYEQTDAVALPSLIEIYVPQQKTAVRITLQGFKVNTPLDPGLFIRTSPEAP